MKINQIHELFTKLGMANDFRGTDGVQKVLDYRKSKFQNLSLKEQEEFDKEALVNPYLDSGVYHVAEDKEIKRVLVGIDIGPEEILLAKQLGNIDLVIAHHPIGKGLAQLARVMDLQVDAYHSYGVPVNITEGLMRERISDVSRSVHASNHQRTVDAAKLLGINVMAAHTSADNMASRFLTNLLDMRKFERVGEIVSTLKEVPEYKESIKLGAEPRVLVGSPENRCGKIAIEMTGGTEGSAKIYEKMAQAGIGTSVVMHVSGEHKKEAEMANINIILMSHMASDSLGMNLLLDALAKEGVEIIACSGFTRFSRV